MKLTPEQIKFRESLPPEPECLTMPSEEILKLIEETIANMPENLFMKGNHDQQISEDFYNDTKQHNNPA